MSHQSYPFPIGSRNDYGLSARASYHAGAIQIICFSSVLLAITLGIGGVQLTHRKPKDGYSKVAWHFLWPATLALAISHATFIGVSAALLKDQDGRHFREIAHFYLQALTALFNGLYTLFTLIAAKAVFFEVTAGKLFIPNERGRWISGLCDLVLFFVIQGSLFATSFANNVCEGMFSSDGWWTCAPNAVDYMMVSIVNRQVSWGFPIVVFLEYGNILVSSFFASRWAKSAGSSSPVADAMVRIVSPLLALQMLACIATMAVGLHVDTQSKAIEFYVSIPFWLLQPVVLGTLLWVLHTRPLLGPSSSDGGGEPEDRPAEEPLI